jgi:hypothetical protein
VKPRGNDCRLLKLKKKSHKNNSQLESIKKEQRNQSINSFIHFQPNKSTFHTFLMILSRRACVKSEALFVVHHKAKE